MNAPVWPVVIEARGPDVVGVDHGSGFVVVIITSMRGCESACLTPAQSATLRAALEAAEQEMS